MAIPQSLTHNINSFKIHSSASIFGKASAVTEEKLPSKKITYGNNFPLVVCTRSVKDCIYYCLNTLIYSVYKSSRVLFYAAGFCCASFKTFCFFLSVYTQCALTLSFVREWVEINRVATKPHVCLYYFKNDSELDPLFQDSRAYSAAGASKAYLKSI